LEVDFCLDVATIDRLAVSLCVISLTSANERAFISYADIAYAFFHPKIFGADIPINRLLRGPALPNMPFEVYFVA
jgi:hypothetical protein